MEIHVRNVDPYYLKEIDSRCKEISKRTGKNYSRSHYINSLIENDIANQYNRDKENKFDKTIADFVSVLKSQDSKLEEFINLTCEVIEKLLEERTE